MTDHCCDGGDDSRRWYVITRYTSRKRVGAPDLIAELVHSGDASDDATHAVWERARNVVAASESDRAGGD